MNINILMHQAWTLVPKQAQTWMLALSGRFWSC